MKRYLNNKQKIIIKEKNKNKKIVFIIISILKHYNKKFNYIIKKKNETIRLNNSTTLIIEGKDTNLWNSKYNILLIDNIKWVKNQKEKKFKNYIKNIKKIIKYPPKGSNLIYYKEKILKKIINNKKYQKKTEYQKNKIKNTKILISQEMLKNLGITNNEFYKSIKLFNLI